MVKHKGRWEIISTEDVDFHSVIGSHRRACGFGNVYGRDGMVPGISVRVGVCMHLPYEDDIQAGFFLCFPDGCIFKRFHVVHKAAGNSPTDGIVLALDQNDAHLVELDNDVNCWERILINIEFRSTGDTNAFVFCGHYIMKINRPISTISFQVPPVRLGVLEAVGLQTVHNVP